MARFEVSGAGVQTHMIRIVLVVLAVVIAALVLLGVDMGSLEAVKALALAVILAAIAVVVP